MNSLNAAALLNTFKDSKIRDTKEISELLADYLPISSSTVATCLCIFAERHVITKVSRGKYIVNPQPIYYKWIDAAMYYYRKRNRNYKKKLIGQM